MGRATRRFSGASRSPRTWAARATAWSSPGRSGSRDAGGLRSQFTHCIDIGPTILEAAGIPEPKVVDGTAQKPMEGTSFLYSFDDATAAERHTVQYFEIVGNRAIYKDGWWAACKLDRIPWDLSPPTMARFAPGTYDPEQDTWELYYLPDDFTQANDLAAEHPEKLAELKELFWEEAEKHNVLPLLAAFSVFFGILPPMPTITTYTFYGDVAEHRLRDDPPRLRALVRDRGRALGPGARRRGRDRRRSGRDGRLLALGRRERAAAPQLLDDGRRAVPASLDRADPDRGRHRPHAVRRRQRRSARPGERSRSTPTTR